MRLCKHKTFQVPAPMLCKAQACICESRQLQRHILAPSLLHRGWHLLSPLRVAKLLTDSDTTLTVADTMTCITHVSICH